MKVNRELKERSLAEHVIRNLPSSLRSEWADDCSRPYPKIYRREYKRSFLQEILLKTGLSIDSEEQDDANVIATVSDKRICLYDQQLFSVFEKICLDFETKTMSEITLHVFASVS